MAQGQQSVEEHGGQSALVASKTVTRAASKTGGAAKKQIPISNYRELVKPAQAAKWFAISPEQPVNIIQVPTGTSATVAVAAASA